MGGIVRSLGELAGHFDELAAKAAAPETREDVLVLLAEEMCRRREWIRVIAYDDWEEDWWEPEKRCPRLREMKVSDDRMREPRDMPHAHDVGNVFLLRLIATEQNRKIMRKWLSELPPEDRSEMMTRGTRWLAGVADHLNELAAEAVAPETREDVFVLIAQKRCEGLAFPFSSSGPFDSPSWSPWCGYGRIRNPEYGDAR